MVDMSTDADGLADFLLCLSGLEDKNSQLFKYQSPDAWLTPNHN